MALMLQVVVLEAAAQINLPLHKCYMKLNFNFVDAIKQLKWQTSFKTRQEMPTQEYNSTLKPTTIPPQGHAPSIGDTLLTYIS